MARVVAGELVNRSYFYWRGGLSILLGVLILVWPSLSILIFVTLISIWLLVIGAVTLVESVSSIRYGGFGWIGPLIVGLLMLGVGAYLVQRPHVTVLTIVTLLGLVFVVQGFAHLMRTFVSPGISGGRRLLDLLMAILAFVAGIWIWRYPAHGTLAFVWLLGLYAIASGALSVAIGSELPE